MDQSKTSQNQNRTPGQNNQGDKQSQGWQKDAAPAQGRNAGSQGTQQGRDAGKGQGQGTNRDADRR